MMYNINIMLTIQYKIHYILIYINTIIIHDTLYNKKEGVQSIQTPYDLQT